MKIFEITARSQGTPGNSAGQRWVVARYVQPSQADTHLQLCCDFLAAANAQLPANLPEPVRARALCSLKSPYDPQYEQHAQAYVTYSLEVHEVADVAPAVCAATPWQGLDVRSDRCAALVYDTMYRVRGDLQHRRISTVSRAALADDLWGLGVHPALPAVGGLLGESSGDAYHRLVVEALADTI